MFSLSKYKGKLASDMAFNTVAAAIPVFILQLVILPFLGRKMDSGQYGLLVTLISMLNLIPAMLGNSLNSIRLLYRDNYEGKNVTGDFQIIFLVEVFLNIFIVASFSVYYGSTYSYNFIHYVLIILASVFWLSREYFVVNFLIILNYKYVLINNLILACGFLFGTLIYIIADYWEVIYIIGYFFSLVYIFYKSDTWKERPVKSQYFKLLVKENFVYVLACLLYRMISYADKMLLFPLLGGTLVAVYYTATLSSKVISLIITPISAVLLAHLSKEKERKKVNSLKKVLTTGSIICIVFYFLCLLISRPVLTLLYPQYVDGAIIYVPITTGTIIIGVLISLINPFILCNFPMKWQVIINAVTVLFYILISFFMVNSLGLMGFCIGCLLTNILKMMIMLIIYAFASKI